MHETLAPIATQISILSTVPGLDVQRGLVAVRGKPDRYLALLRQFVAQHAHDMERLQVSLAAGDHETARRIAHSLKGAGATLGVERVKTVATPGVTNVKGKLQRRPDKK